MFRKESNILSIQFHEPLINIKAAAYSIKHGRLAGSVGTDNGNKITVFYFQIQVIQCCFFIYRSFIEGLANIHQF